MLSRNSLHWRASDLGAPQEPLASRCTRMCCGQERRGDVARLMQGCCGPHRSTSGLLQCTMCMHYVHHKQEGADDVSGLLIAALTASAHAIGRGSEGGCCTCDAVLLQPPT